MQGDNIRPFKINDPAPLYLNLERPKETVTINNDFNYFENEITEDEYKSGIEKNTDPYIKFVEEDEKYYKRITNFPKVLENKELINEKTYMYCNSHNIYLGNGENSIYEKMLNGSMKNEIYVMYFYTSDRVVEIDVRHLWEDNNEPLDPSPDKNPERIFTRDKVVTLYAKEGYAFLYHDINGDSYESQSEKVRVSGAQIFTSDVSKGEVVEVTFYYQRGYLTVPKPEPEKENPKSSPGTIDESTGVTHGYYVDGYMYSKDVPNQLIGSQQDYDFDERNGSYLWVLDKHLPLQINFAYTKLDHLIAHKDNPNGYTSNYNIVVNYYFGFDVYDGGSLVKAGNPITRTYQTSAAKVDEEGNYVWTVDLTKEITVPIWIEEKDGYIVYAEIRAEYDNTCPVDHQKENRVGAFNEIKSRIVGQVYDFTINNLQGDDVWRASLFANGKEYKANQLPIGQGTQQSEKYNAGIMKGSKFYFHLATKGEKNSQIEIIPSFYYLPKTGGAIKKVDLYQNGKDISGIERISLANDSYRASATYQQERTAGATIYAQAYQNLRPSIGTYGKEIIGTALRTPFIGYESKILGKSLTTLSNEKGEDLKTKVSHWYGDYSIPNNVTFVTTNADGKKEVLPIDGTILVYFSIKTYDGTTPYLGYNLASPDGDGDETQWEIEGIADSITLPRTVAGKDPITLDTGIKGTGVGGSVPVIIYGNLTTKQNYDVTGTH